MSSLTWNPVTLKKSRYIIVLAHRMAAPQDVLNRVGHRCVIVFVGRRSVVARPISIMVVLKRFFVVRFNLFW